MWCRFVSKYGVCDINTVVNMKLSFSNCGHKNLIERWSGVMTGYGSYTLGKNGLNPWLLVISVVHTLGNDGLNLQPLVSWVWSIFWAKMG